MDGWTCIRQINKNICTSEIFILKTKQAQQRPFINYWLVGKLNRYYFYKKITKPFEVHIL